MERLPLRRLLVGPPPDSTRILYTNVWFRDWHNNARYSELLPRLARLDRALVLVPRAAPARAAAYRALRASKPARDRLLLRAAGRRYRSLFTTDLDQIAHFRGRVVADVDDTGFTEREAELLERPGVEAYVVTAERAAERFRSLGVTKPHYVIPQGANARAATPDAVERVRARHGRTGEVVVGYMAAWLLLPGDRGGSDPLYDVTHLLELWNRIHARVPHARLWLVGGVSDRVRARLAGRDDVLVLGRIARGEMPAVVKSFDVALYPRTEDQGIRAAKVGEYIGLGVPTVSYDFRVTSDLRETGAGVLVGGPDEFVDAVVRLADDETALRAATARAEAAAPERDWELLAARYGEILDRHLPR